MKLSSPVVRRHVVPALLVLGLCGAVARADERAEVDALLQRAAGATDAQVTALGRQLAELGPRVDEVLFDALATESATPESRRGPRAAALLAAFESMGAKRWRPLLAARFAAGGNPSLVGPLFAITGRGGTAEDVPFVLKAAALDVDGTRRAELEQSVTDILRRHEAAFDAVDQAIPAITPELRTSMIRAVEGTKLPRASLLLARWIERRVEMRFESLPYLARLSLSLDKPLPPEVLAPVRVLVESADGPELHEAVLCAGRLCDYEAIPALVRHLKEGDYGLRAEALWSLRTITRLQFGADPRDWTKWFDEESNWWNNESRSAFQDLVTGSRARKIEVLREVSILHAWRDRAAAEIAIALGDADAEVAVQAAVQLKRLDSRLAIPELVEAVAGNRPVVVQAARDALQSITKLELPADPAAVREALLPLR
jgi:hypothetical protein